MVPKIIGPTDRDEADLPMANMRHNREARALNSPIRVDRDVRAAEFTCQPV